MAIPLFSWGGVPECVVAKEIKVDSYNLIHVPLEMLVQQRVRSGFKNAEIRVKGDEVRIKFVF